MGMVSVTKKAAVSSMGIRLEVGRHTMTFGMASKLQGARSKEQGARSKDGLMDTGYEVHVACMLCRTVDRTHSIEDALNEQ
jgi:hypothetical protein